MFLAVAGIAALTGTAAAADTVADRPTVVADHTDADANDTDVSYEVSNLTVQSGDDENVTVVADIQNPGPVPAIQPVELRVNGELVEMRPWALNPNETEQIAFELTTGAVNETDGTDAPGQSDGAPGQSGDAPGRSGQAGPPTAGFYGHTPLYPVYGAPAAVSEGDIVSVQTRMHGEAVQFDSQSTEPPAGEAAITFEDQTSDGANVTVANASSDETPYYAAVWTVDETTGAPVNLLGAVQVNETETSDLTVGFDEPIAENQTLVAAVHPDQDGSVDTVDPDTETILASDTANVTVEAAQEPEPPASEAAITFEDQTSDGTTVTVANASNNETPYYAAVWTVDSATGEPDTLLGAAQVNETEASDTTVEFDEPIEENQTLVAAVHPDQDGSVDTVDPDTETILASDTANVTVEAAQEPEPPAEEASITFEDQTSDGANVTVADASNNETPYYAAVWTVDSATGEPDTLLGAAQVNETEASDVAVSFEEPIAENQTLVAAVHPDQDGSVDTVDPDTETILASDTANVTVEAAQEPEPPAGEAAITFEDQTSDGTTVTVANASNNETPYYVAVGTANETTGGPGALLGLTQVTETETSDLVLVLDESINESQTLVATVHPDDDGDVGTEDPLVDTILASDDAEVTVETSETASLVTVLR